MRVHVGDGTHDDLAIHAVGDPSVPRDGVTEVLHLKQQAVRARKWAGLNALNVSLYRAAKGA